MTKFSVLCAWCGAIAVDSGPGSMVSHGICPPCGEKQLQELTAMAAGGQPGEKPAVEWHSEGVE